jgi:hypothetical protein
VVHAVLTFHRGGNGPERIKQAVVRFSAATSIRLRRFAIGLIKSKGVYSVAQTMRQLNRNTRLVFDYLRMTKNSCATAAP